MLYRISSDIFVGHIDICVEKLGEHLTRDTESPGQMSMYLSCLLQHSSCGSLWPGTCL